MSANEQPFQTIALFGSTGQIGSAILNALLKPSVPDYSPTVRVILSSQDSEKQDRLPKDARVKQVQVDDLKDVKKLAEALKGVNAVVSALNGPGIELQYGLLDACGQAGVTRFIPSEFGCHQLYRAPGDKGARLHPMWDEKQRFQEQMLLHPAIQSEKLEFTVVGCGDFYDQPRETYWSAWANPEIPQKYRLPVVGDPNKKAEFSKITDLAQYVAALLARPSTSRNAYLNFVSDTLSQQEMADLLQSASGRPVEVDYVSEEQAHEYIANPDKAPEHVKESSFPADFWYTVKLSQGLGLFRRHPSQIHNDLYPEVHATRFAEWLTHEVAPKAMGEKGK